jgi:hypothetical protein
MVTLMYVDEVHTYINRLGRTGTYITLMTLTTLKIQVHTLH